mmetsp:Transcript_39112/g.83319  ORF Transcript_39112/g.83319 Transcript_39112/m.83319 type:complete len:745 (-) Transcript_39112:185-2419(-)
MVGAHATSLVVLLLPVVAIYATETQPKTRWYDGLEGVKVINPAYASQHVVDDIFESQYDGQFNEQRYALLLTSGVYPKDFHIKVGYYTSVIGVGTAPSRVRLRSVTSKNGASGHATNNFWRSFEGISLWSEGAVWAVSQGAPLRRSVIEGNLLLSDAGGFSSGGFLADVKVVGRVELGSQQQWFFRNADLQGGLGCPGGWNYVFVGVNGVSPQAAKDCRGDTPGKVSIVTHTPRIAEKPFLVQEDDAETWHIYVPAYGHTPSSGSTGDHRTRVDRRLRMEDEIFIARPGDTDEDINQGIAGRRGLLLTPGIYRLKGAIVVRTEGFVVLGIGFPTLIATTGNPAVQIESGLSDVRIAGLLIEAGTPVGWATPVWPLLRWGTHVAASQGQGARASGVLTDVFVRVGAFKYQGCAVVRSDILMEINSDDVVLDNTWVWHADHDDCGTNPEVGAHGKSDQCKSIHGLVVRGRRVTAYGLSVEHIVGRDQLLWTGEGGEMYFYQSELPYHSRNRYAGYTVAPSVAAHAAWGLGVYIIGGDVKVKAAFSVPPLVKATNLFSVVIHGRPNQFRNIVCSQLNEGGGERCFQPESCQSMRCFLASVPRWSPVPEESPRLDAASPSLRPATAPGWLMPAPAPAGKASSVRASTARNALPGSGHGVLASCRDPAATSWSLSCAAHDWLLPVPLPLLVGVFTFFLVVFFAPLLLACRYLCSAGPGGVSDVLAAFSPVPEVCAPCEGKFRQGSCESF